MNFVTEHYDLWRALHVISVIFWMAGMLYLPRLYVYHHQSEPAGELEAALLKQESRLLEIIMNPAISAVWLFGLLLIAANAGRAGGWQVFGSLAWSLKFVLVIAMSGIHGVYAAAFKKFARGERPWSERAWRMMNEVPALGTIVIVLIAIVWLR